jgi:hypothetical protein
MPADPRMLEMLSYLSAHEGRVFGKAPATKAERRRA